LGRKKTSVDPSVSEKKNSGLRPERPGRIWSWCRWWSAGLEAFSGELGWMRFFGVLRSHPRSWILKCAGREAEVPEWDERRQKHSQTCTQKAFSTMRDTFVGIFLLKRLQWTLRQKFSRALNCCLMIRERSAGPRMISRLEHKFHLGVCACAFGAKHAIYYGLQKRYMLWRSACVCMCAKLRMFLHLSAFIKSWPRSLYENKGWTVILHVCLHLWARVQETECVYVCVGHVLETVRIQGLHAHAQNLSKVCMRMHISRFGTLHDVSVRTVHVLACVDPIYWYSWASIRIRRLVSKLSMRLHLMASIKSWG
jgi:hypothetical protein